MFYTICNSQHSDQDLHYLSYFLSSIIKVYTVCHSQHFDQGQHYLPFSVWSGSTLFTIRSSLTIVYTILHSQSDQGLHCCPFSAVWSGSTLFSLLSCLIRIYTVCHSSLAVLLRSSLFAFVSSLIRFYTNCDSRKSHQCLHSLPFSTVWSGSTLFSIITQIYLIRVYNTSQFQQSDQGQTVKPIRVYTIFHSQQSHQGLHRFHFSAVWSGSTLFPLSGWSESTLFATFSNLIRICTICHSSLAVLLRPKPLPLSAIWSGSILFLGNLISIYTVCHSQQFDQGLHYLPFSVWSGSTLRAILSSLICVYTFCFAIISSLIRVYTVCHSQPSDQGLHYLPFSAVLSGSRLFAILSSLIKVYTVCHCQQFDHGPSIFHFQQSDQGLHYLAFYSSSIISLHCLPFSQFHQGLYRLSFSGVWSRCTPFAILSNLIRDYTMCHSQQSDQGQGLRCHSPEQSDQGLHFLPF